VPYRYPQRPIVVAIRNGGGHMEPRHLDSAHCLAYRQAGRPGGEWWRGRFF